MTTEEDRFEKEMWKNFEKECTKEELRFLKIALRVETPTPEELDCLKVFFSRIAGR